MTEEVVAVEEDIVEMTIVDIVAAVAVADAHHHHIDIEDAIPDQDHTVHVSYKDNRQ